MLYNCTHMATVGVKGLTRSSWAQVNEISMGTKSFCP